MTMIRFEHVDKAYDLQAGRRTLFGALKLVTSAPVSNELFYALSDVSFEIHRGEAFGIIGRNGAGKSTILKIIAGITSPTRGSVTVEGRVSSLIELGAGFHPDLTGRENIFMSGAILGMPRKFIENKFNEIVDFAELWDFIDVPVKKYSSGMYARLGFSVAVSVEPEILIIDEILSVGDVFFQQKCFTKMREIIKQGTTFIYVTHDTAGMQNLCDRALVLDVGKVVFEGSTTEAVSKYYGKMSPTVRRDGIVDESSTRPRPNQNIERSFIEACHHIRRHDIAFTAKSAQGDKGMEIVGATFENEKGEHSYRVQLLRQVVVRVLVRANRDILNPNVGFSLFDRMNNLIFSVGVLQRGLKFPPLKSDDERVVTFRIHISVYPGEYTFVLGCGESDPFNIGEGFTHHRLFGLGPIDVVDLAEAVPPFFGIANLDTEITLND